ncbi:MAG: hypothetical protein MJ152_03490 [Clostridia bacterium]|nr:hypothetical protein [Clostridia bacterium]
MLSPITKNETLHTIKIEDLPNNICSPNDYVSIINAFSAAIDTNGSATKTAGQYFLQDKAAYNRFTIIAKAIINQLDQAGGRMKFRHIPISIPDGEYFTKTAENLIKLEASGNTSEELANLQEKFANDFCNAMCEAYITNEKTLNDLSKKNPKLTDGISCEKPAGIDEIISQYKEQKNNKIK